MTYQYTDGSVEFRFLRPGARNVLLMGEFNHWGKPGTPMSPTDRGWWHCRLRLDPGSYQFKYWADGSWYTDYAAFGLDQGPQQTWNSLLIVRPPALRPDRSGPCVEPSNRPFREDHIMHASAALFRGGPSSPPGESTASRQATFLPPAA